MIHLFPRFLTDESEYAKAEAFWTALWERIAPDERRQRGWSAEWFRPQPPKDGNPIFTAVSELRRKAIRVIQYEPTSDGLEIDFWLDTFGGDLTDPDAIVELVISCALSVETAQKAYKFITSWVIGEEIKLTKTLGVSGTPNGD